ncbi:MAG: lipid A biosynthesis acyltransferase, partial [Acidovorax sp.]
VRMLNRSHGVKPIIANLRQGGLLYLLPDMDYGRNDSVFVPFYGVTTATIPSLSRFARLGRAKVVGVYSRMTPTGYVAEVSPAWANFPTDDVDADTERMNRELQAVIDTMPEQYYWVHKRFKTRPEGEPGLY